MLFDAHSHLPAPLLSPHLPPLWPELRRLGVACVVVNGTEPADWPAVQTLAREHPETLPSYGLHPWRLAQSPPDWPERLEAFLLEALRTKGPGEPGSRMEPAPLVPVAVGEIGLDRSRPGTDAATQKAAFTRQLALAARWNLPASIHCVKAWGAMGEILRTRPLPERGLLLHAYNGPAEMLPPLLKSGAYFSFSGHHLRRASAAQTAWQERFRRIPADRLLVETDAPDGLAALPPGPALPANGDAPPAFAHRYAAGLQTLYAALAALRGCPPDVLEAQIAENFQRLFGAKACISPGNRHSGRP